MTTRKKTKNKPRDWTIRDDIALEVLNGIVSSKYFRDHCSEVGGDRPLVWAACVRAYQFADAMLAVREVPE